MRTIAMLVGLAVGLGGCFPDSASPCWVISDAEAVAKAFSIIEGIDLTPEEAECIRGIRIAWVENIDRWCDSGIACYYLGRRENRRHVIIVSAMEWGSTSEARRMEIVEHELIHHAMWCVYGDADADHSASAWEYGPWTVMGVLERFRQTSCNEDGE